MHFLGQRPVPPADGDRRAGAGAAGQRLADAALEHAQPDVVRRDDLEEADVHAPRKARVILHRGSDAVHRRVVAPSARGSRRAGCRSTRRRISTGPARQCRCGSSPPRARRVERQRARIEVRHAHRHGHQAVGAAAAPRRGRPGCPCASGRSTSPRRARDEPRDAARAVAALLDLGAVGVEDAVVDVGAGAARRLEHQRLVEADAGAAVARRRSVAGRGHAPSAPAASKTMKSLPRPCIFVKASRIRAGYPTRASLTASTRDRRRCSDP